MPIKRRVHKARENVITDEALQIFAQMRRLPCTCSPAARRGYEDDCPGCREWWRLHPFLRRATNGKMWLFPTISRFAPDRRRAWPDDSEEYRYLQLEAALQARRRPAAKDPQPAPSPA